jgi:hypothetical protein
MSQRSIEVKVGVLILVALGLLGGFIVIMGGLSRLREPRRPASRRAGEDRRRQGGARQ